jgi:hypothetical protein
MKIDRFMNVAYLSFVALAFLGAGAGEARAQALKPCAGAPKGTCVEFTVRYYQDSQVGKGAPKDRPKVVIVGGDEKNACYETPKNTFGLKSQCQASTAGYKPIDTSRIDLKQSFKNPTCYQVCNNGWCWDECY